MAQGTAFTQRYDAGCHIGLQTGGHQVKDHISTFSHQKCPFNSEFQVDKSEEPGQHQVPNSIWPLPLSALVESCFL